MSPRERVCVIQGWFWWKWRKFGNESGSWEGKIPASQKYNTVSLRGKTSKSGENKTTNTDSRVLQCNYPDKDKLVVWEKYWIMTKMGEEYKWGQILTVLGKCSWIINWTNTETLPIGAIQLPLLMGELSSLAMPQGPWKYNKLAWQQMVKSNRLGSQ